MLKELSIKEKLKGLGFKTTKVRSALIDIFETTHTPLSAAELINLLAEEKISVNKSTIYREIDFLVEQKLLNQINLGDRNKRYELEHDHHHHLICEKCKSIQDISIEEDFINIEKRIEKENKFTIKSHNLEFFGLCKNCRS